MFTLCRLKLIKTWLKLKFIKISVKVRSTPEREKQPEAPRISALSEQCFSFLQSINQNIHICYIYFIDDGKRSLPNGCPQASVPKARCRYVPLIYFSLFDAPLCTASHILSIVLLLSTLWPVIFTDRLFLHPDQQGVLTLDQILSVKKIPGVTHPISNSALLLLRVSVTETR